MKWTSFLLAKDASLTTRRAQGQRPSAIYICTARLICIYHLHNYAHLSPFKSDDVFHSARQTFVECGHFRVSPLSARSLCFVEQNKIRNCKRKNASRHISSSANPSTLTQRPDTPPCEDKSHLNGCVSW